MSNIFVASTKATIINGTQVWFQIELADGRRFDVDVNLWNDPSGRTGFHSRFGLPNRSEVVAEAHHLDDIEAIVAPVAVENQSQQVRYVHGEVYPSLTGAFVHEICPRCKGSGREHLSLACCVACGGSGRSAPPCQPEVVRMDLFCGAGSESSTLPAHEDDGTDVDALISRLENRAADETWSANPARREVSLLLREAAQALRAKTRNSSSSAVPIG